MFEYIVLLHDILTFLCHSAVTLICGIMFWKKMITIKTTPTMLIFFYYLIAFNFSATLYRTYLIAFWRPNELLYNQQAIYWIGIWQWVLRRTSTHFETALCIERSLAIAFPFQYSRRWKLSICYVTCALFFILSFATVFFNNLLQIPESKITQCMFFCCVIKCGSELYLVVTSLIEFVSAIILLCVIKFNPVQYATKKNKTKAILIIVFISLFCDLTPNLIDEIWFFFSNTSLINIIGTYHATLSAIGVTLSVSSYYIVFSKQKLKGHTVNVS